MNGTTVIDTRHRKAMAACVNYDWWASEVKRLTDEIMGCECPKEIAGERFEGDDGATFTEQESCFSLARQTHYGVRPKLWQIVPRVKDCPACSRLCELIAERKVARRKWGAAKREVRRIARKYVESL